jgi:hypothetical protein
MLTSQVGIRSINAEGREQGKRFGVEQFEMRTFSRDRHFLENLVSLSLSLSLFLYLHLTVYIQVTILAHRYIDMLICEIHKNL